jgi:hypothetical protein
VWEYVHKDPDALDFAPWTTKNQEKFLQPPDDMKVMKRNWAMIIQAKSPDEFLKRVLELDPYTAAICHMRLLDFIKYKYKSTVERFQSHFGPDAFPWVTEEIKQWVQEEFPKQGCGPKALILWGPTRMGKMQWAWSLGKHH